MVALEIEDHTNGGRVADEGAVALVGFDHEQVRVPGPGIARQSLRLKFRQIAPGDDRGVAAGALENGKHHRRDRRLAARARHRDGAMPRHEMGKQLRAMNDGNVLRPRRGEVRHVLLDCGGDDERRAIGAEPAAVLGLNRDAETLELGMQPFALAAVERPVAAADNASGHYLKLGERTHAGAAKTCIVKAPSAIRVGDRPRFGRGDEHEIAFAHAGEELAHGIVRQPHATMRDGAA